MHQMGLVGLVCLLVSMTGGSVIANAPTYVGVENCRVCHIPHFESWGSTKMSQAFDLLKPGARPEAKVKAGLDPEEDYRVTPGCLPCHVTGYGHPGGFVDLQETPDMTGVQCEMCHGPGSIYTEMMLEKIGTYTLEDYKSKGGLWMPSIEENVCTNQCHNENSPFINSGFQFNFEDRKAIGTHSHNLEYIYLPFDL